MKSKKRRNETRMQTRQGQVAFEFVALIALAMLVFTIFIYVLIENRQDIQDENEYNYLVDLSKSVQSELYLASSVGDGYLRTLQLPDLLDNRYEYSINVFNNSLVTSTSRYQEVLTIPTIQGNITKGDNVINKTDGEIYVS